MCSTVQSILTRSCVSGGDLYTLANMHDMHNLRDWVISLIDGRVVAAVSPSIYISVPLGLLAPQASHFCSKGVCVLLSAICSELGLRVASPPVGCRRSWIKGLVTVDGIRGEVARAGRARDSLHAVSWRAAAHMAGMCEPSSWACFCLSQLHPGAEARK